MKPSGKQRCLDYWSKYSLTMKECWSQCANIWCVFSCTLSIFPAVQSRVRPVNPEYFIPPLWFVDVTCFLFFNVFAMLGCILCNWIQFPGPRYLWIPVLLRTIIFIPFFLSCNFGIENPHLSVLITNDHIYVLGCILFAFSNGHLASLGLMYAPRCCSPDRAPLAGMFAAFFLILGVFTGVYASRGLNSLIY
uniref:Equilibrative nucleoside transporter 1 n=1 Tax=Schistosoma haematobium TaxID=6185 RepID=A0A094ZWD6_SCHHA